MLDVFRGKWMVFAGASNLILTASLFANMNGGVGGGDFFAPFQQAMFDQSGLIDIIWRGKDGVYSPLHAERYEWGTPAPRGATGNDDANRLWESSSMDLIEEQLAKGSAAAAFAADVDGADATVRTTLVVGQYWTNTAKTAAAIRSAAARANGWGDAKVVIYSQITNWYLNCAYPANPYCSRADLAMRVFDWKMRGSEAPALEGLDLGSLSKSPGSAVRTRPGATPPEAAAAAPPALRPQSALRPAPLTRAAAAPARKAKS